MNPEIFIHHRNRLKARLKRAYRKSLKAIVKSKLAIIASSNITFHYAKEMRLQAKNFKNNINQINRFDYEKRITDYTRTSRQYNAC